MIRPRWRRGAALFNRWHAANLEGTQPTAPSWPPVRHPFQVFLMGASVVSGSVGLIVAGTSPSLARVLDSPTLLLWQLGLAISGVLGLVAAVKARSDEAWSMLLERLALLVIGPYACIYGLIVGTTSPGGLAVAPILTGYGTACLWRAWQVHRRVKWVEFVNAHQVQFAPPDGAS
jgi:hypothetical protein